jgi:hypothetical protein
MGIVIRKARHQQEGEKIKSTTMPIELQKGTSAEEICSSFEGFPFGGYHSSTPADYLKGNKGSPYSRQYTCDGKLLACGINWFERHVQRLDVLLRTTGESVTLWRRKWTGEACPKCSRDTRTNRGYYRCPLCFGTNFVGGYVRFINSREPNGNIFVRFGPTQEDLILQEGGLTQGFNPAGWTLPCPILRDWDIIIRYDPDTNEETWRYEITNVTRNKGFFNVSTAQNFTASRVDRTDPIYLIKEVDLQDGLVGRLSGDHDEKDLLQTQYEKRFGQGHEDRGFSDGYQIGFMKGYQDGFGNLDYLELPDGLTGDSAYGNLQLTPQDKENWLMGYRAGYEDGFESGQEKRRQDGYQAWTPVRNPGDVRTTEDPPVPVQDYDELARHPEIWNPKGL